jgi:hypothetical protein
LIINTEESDMQKVLTVSTYQLNHKMKSKGSNMLSSVREYFIKITLVLLTVITNGSCGDKLSSDTIIEGEGFIVYHDSNVWHFVLGEPTNEALCINDFKSRNLGKGYQFTPHVKEHIRIVEAAAYSYRVENIGLGFAEKYYTVNVAPVKAKFKIIYNKTDRIVKTQPEFVVKVEGEFVRFNYDFVDAELTELAILNCSL